MRILMVCLGNICRSPLAEGIMQHKINARQLPWEVDSAGTGGWHAGSPPDARSIAVARQHGIDITRQRARQFQIADFEAFDRIFVMDAQNYNDVIRKTDSEQHRAKVVLLRNAEFPGRNLAVPDPYYDDDGFEAVFQMVDSACEAFIEAQSR